MLSYNSIPSDQDPPQIEGLPGARTEDLNSMDCSKFRSVRFNIDCPVLDKDFRIMFGRALKVVSNIKNCASRNIGLKQNQELRARLTSLPRISIIIVFSNHNSLACSEHSYPMIQTIDNPGWTFDNFTSMLMAFDNLKPFNCLTIYPPNNLHGEDVGYHIGILKSITEQI